MSGRWQTSCGDVYLLDDLGDDVTLKLESSENFCLAFGKMAKSGNRLTGTISGVFRGDPTRSIRHSRIDGRIVNVNDLNLMADAIVLDGFGREVKRDRGSVEFLKLD